ncbi:MAG TPA: hypothetical protein VML19_26745 [Verrucomicrobiae bacterium]|nr:hypothetical protein [Verrucomicrobiae bacterium]
MSSALAAWLAASAAPARAQGNRTAARNRKNFVAIQMKPHAWLDEGIEACLDNLQMAGVNTVWAYTYDWEMGARNTPGGSIPLPDHGKYGDPKFSGGAFYNYERKYFGGTILNDFRSPDYGNWDVIAEVAPKAKARGMDFFCWDYNNESRRMIQNMPNAAKVTEIDINGRRMIGPCFNHPDYRAHLIGKVESYLRGYPGQVDGIAWGCERQGPFQNIMGGGWTSEGIGCFCPFCRDKARARGISVERAQAGYRQFRELLSAAAHDQRPADGYFVTFWRVLQEYPEILSWEKLWTDSYHEVRAELYGAAKSMAPEKPFGFHIMQNMTFSPFYRAEEDFSKTRDYADYLKLATYNNAGGPRMKSYLDRLSATIFHDAGPKDFVEFYYKIMNYQEGPYETLNTSGLTADYVAREVRRARAGAGPNLKLYPGIDIDVPTRQADKRTKPDDVRRSIHAAFEAGADGCVLAREYVEMWLANLKAAGEALREVFAGRQ